MNRAAALFGPTFEARLEKRVERDPNSGCWLWSGNLRDGYGQMGVRGGLVRSVHRLTYEAYRGPLAPGQVVCHRCDTPACVNPSHLWAGTHADNVADKMSKGRYVNGRKYQVAAHPAARLTEDQARRILASVAAGQSQTSAANDYGVSRTAVHWLVTGRNWPHLTREALRGAK